jgi:hypothetical protein
MRGSRPAPPAGPSPAPGEAEKKRCGRNGLLKVLARRREAGAYDGQFSRIRGICWGSGANVSRETFLVQENETRIGKNREGAALDAASKFRSNCI